MTAVEKLIKQFTHQARPYAQTLYLAEKYGLPVPENLRHQDDGEWHTATPDDA